MVLKIDWGTSMKVVITGCGMCGGDYCGVDVQVENGRIVDIKGSKDVAWVCNRRSAGRWGPCDRRVCVP